MTMKDAKAAATNEYRNQAALHGPDRVVGGYKDLYTGTGDNPINSAIGSHWGQEWRAFDRSIRQALRSRGIASVLWGDLKLNVRFTVNGKLW